MFYPVNRHFQCNSLLKFILFYVYSVSSIRLCRLLWYLGYGTSNTWLSLKMDIRLRSDANYKLRSVFLTLYNYWIQMQNLVLKVLYLQVIQSHLLLRVYHIPIWTNRTSFRILGTSWFIVEFYKLLSKRNFWAGIFEKL